MTEREELRKLAEATKIGGPGVWDDAKVLARIYQLNAWGTGLVTATEFIAAANPAAALDLIDQLDAAEAKLAAAEAKLAAVRELHQPINAINEWVTCCECFDPADGGEWVQWPCPTIRALDEGTDHE